MNFSKITIVLLIATTFQDTSAETQLTTDAAGHQIHNSQIFSPDGKWIIFDSRNDDTLLRESSSIGIVNVVSGKTKTIYRLTNPSPFGPGVGAATFSPTAPVAAFIHGLNNASELRPYSVDRRSAYFVSLENPLTAKPLDARDVTAPFTPGALRGGTHAHHWSGDGQWISFTYNDSLITSRHPDRTDLRTIGVMKVGEKVNVSPQKDADDFSGNATSFLLVPVTDSPRPGSEDLSRAYEEGWIGKQHALAFLGDLSNSAGKKFTELFVVEFPVKMEAPETSGADEKMPTPPPGTTHRRLTYTGGIIAPRHWIRSSPDGKTIAFLNTAPSGIVQLMGASPEGGEIRQLSDLTESVESTFTWSPDGKRIAFSAGKRVQVLDISSGRSTALTEIFPEGQEPRNGFVFSPDGGEIAFNRYLPHPKESGLFLQVCTVDAIAKSTPPENP